MSLRPICIALAAAAAAWVPAVAQDAGFGLRRLSPPEPIKPAPRRTAPPKPAPAPQAQKPAPAAASAPAPRALPAAAVPYQRTPAPAGLAPIGSVPALVPAGNRPVIIIDSRRIGDPNGAVIEVARASRQVAQEFAPRTEALVKLRKEAEQTQAAADAARGREKETLAAKARLQKAEFDTRNAALEKEFKARSDTLLTPVQFRINESLKAFANASGATVVLDGARFNGAVLAMKAGTDPASLDLTTAFIDSYNKAHP